MLTNCVARLRYKVLFTAFLLLFLAPANTPVLAQTSLSILSAQTEETEMTEENLEKEEAKPGKEVEIDLHFFVRLAMNLVTVFLIIHFIYYPNYKKMDTIFTFITFNVTIFILTFVLNTVKISMGAAFGLFAVFSMLRYRTSGIHIKDMTYLFIFIALGLISSIPMDLYELAIISALIFASTWLLDMGKIIKKESLKSIRYENIDKIQPDKEEELIAELKIRTGLNIHRISVQEIDYLKDTAIINIYYYEV